jgi:DNA-binding FrmR family transcriptional regulator
VLNSATTIVYESHLPREKLDLINRTKKVIGQLESILRALNEDASCADVLERLAAAQGAVMPPWLTQPKTKK